MIYVEILGRMGNQMFSYAFARYLQMTLKRQTNSKIALDFSNFEYPTPDWKNDLVHFKCEDNIVEQKRELSVIQRSVLFIYFRLKNKCSIHNESDLMAFEEKWQFFLNIFGIYLCSFNFHRFKFAPLFKNVLLLGFYESPQFFESIDNVIKSDFELIKEEFSEEIQKLISVIEESESVCVGVRKGDFESSELSGFCSVCGKKYFETAINKMLSIKANAHFFFFSNDSAWVYDNLQVPENSIVIEDSEIGLVNYEKLHVMSKCKNFIISNSTFDWWSQHLCRHKNKVVIAPSRWRNITPETHVGIYEKEWILVNPD